MSILNTIREIYEREVPANPSEPHKWFLYLPARSFDGKWWIGSVWRKKKEGGFEFRRRADTDEDWAALQW